ncbi:MAG: hypothetical protein C0625_03515 [Arcobacter sp.]|nr:MAG: hypothetical protein C0625_03515 [Arcobacter sp.]
MSEDNQVIIKYLTYTNSFESKAHFNAKTYQDLVEEIDHSTRVYGLKLIVYNYSKKITINGKEVTLITVIDDLSDEEILDHQLISLYLFILIFLTLVHVFLGFRKKTTAREKELANRIIEYDK